KLQRWLKGAKITIIDKREIHLYQPGLTLVASGVYDDRDVQAQNADYMPRDVNWVKDTVAAFDPDANKVVTGKGEEISYDYLIVATGCHLDYTAIEGMNESLIGREGIGSVYNGVDAALATLEESQKFIDKGGTALFTVPATPIKCAGAPLKMTFLTESRMRDAGTRDKGEFLYLSNSDRLFSQPDFNELVHNLYEEKGIEYTYHHVLKAIDPGARKATFSTQDGDVTYDYDYIHVVPPMRAPDVVRNSALAHQEGSFAEGGWLDVDQYTLQHNRYPNVFGVGDINGIPVGKTAASVKIQAPVAAENLIAMIADKELEARYDGYTSCPLITGLGRAALAEFNFDYELVPTFPLIDQTKPRWIWWQFKVHAIKPFYYQMLKGRVPA
ncbi:MAG TPA: NAD(P)/FAD-dependent oxidoreductase, partial [Halothiobacillaceae bacterium]|nr:NAD(P)/FAD-dependent oxidoreductase [Halothiobacillaceae bacterium]